jgi:hypothetical protein
LPTKLILFPSSEAVQSPLTQLTQKSDARPPRSSSVLRAWEGICLFAESQFGREKVIVRGHQQNERIGSRFRDNGAQRITVGSRHRPAATNDRVFWLPLCAAGQKLGSGWSSHGPPKLGEQEYRQCRSSALCFLEADQVLATLGQLLKRLVALGSPEKAVCRNFSLSTQ